MSNRLIKRVRGWTNSAADKLVVLAQREMNDAGLSSRPELNRIIRTAIVSALAAGYEYGRYVQRRESRKERLHA